MAQIDGALLDFKRLDRLSAGETALHRLDPRAKVLVTLVFLVCVVSFGRYEISALVPFFIYPVLLIALGDLPAGYLARKVALVLPFALTVGIANPILDTHPVVQLGPFAISGGWISCASIVLRTALSVAAALTLVALTGFPAVCRGLERLGMPVPFVLQLIFLYRYIFVLTEEGARTSRARELRSCGSRGLGLRGYAPLVGSLLVRTWTRADRVHMAMLARGFNGAFPTRQEFRFGAREMAYLAGWCGLFLFLRLNNAAQLLGSFLSGLFS